MPQTFQIRREGMTVELLLHQAYGVAGRALLEETLEKNPGLSSLGPILPLGTILTISDRPQPGTTANRPVVSLFGD